VIRQAHTYLVSAMGGATLIAVAIAVFALLVSAQVFKDWPIAALGSGSDETAAVSRAHPAADPGAAAVAAAAGPAGAATTAANRKGAAGGSSGGGASVAAQDGIDSGGGESTEPGQRWLGRWRGRLRNARFLADPDLADLRRQLRLRRW